jgi:3-methyladenine DNA glycosylase AlkD
MTNQLAAKTYLEKLQELASPEVVTKYKKLFTPHNQEDNQFLGVGMGQIFVLAKEFTFMEPAEIEKLLDNPYHEARVGAVSIMDFQVRSKKTTEARRKELFDLYIQRHDRINNWDFVDRAAPRVVGGYLMDKPRDILYELAHSKNTWERRTAIVSTLYFIKQDELDDTFRITEILFNDDHGLIQKAVGWALRVAGDKDKPQLLNFLDKNNAAMPRTLVRYATEKLTPEEKKQYRRG